MSGGTHLHLHARRHCTQYTGDMLKLFQGRILSGDILLREDGLAETSYTFWADQLTAKDEGARLPHIRKRRRCAGQGLAYG